MGRKLNESGDLVPAEKLYKACRIMARYVEYKGGLEWDFSQLHTMPIDSEFTDLIESYLASVLESDALQKGWKLPETTLIYPWIVRMFPEAKYIHWVRDPRDSIAGKHLTDDLAKFGIEYEETDDLFRKRAISWKYQREIIKATPPPRNSILVRFEDFILKQEETLERLEEYLGFRLIRIPVRTAPVGRWKREGIPCNLEIFNEELVELGYEL